MIYSIRRTTAAHGTPEAATPGVRTTASWATVHASNGNGGAIYVGGVDETTKACAVQNAADHGGAYVGHRLAPGDFVNMREVGGATYIDLQYVYVDVDTSGDAWVVNYGRR